MARVKKNRNEPIDLDCADLKEKGQVVCVATEDDSFEPSEVEGKAKRYYGKDSNIIKIVANNIMALRSTYNLTQKDLADRIDFSVGTISGVELGKTMPTIYFIDKISRTFGIPIESLISDHGVACYYKIQVKFDSGNPVSTVFPFRFSEDEQKLMVQLHFIGAENRKKIKKEVLDMLLEKIQ